MATVVRRNDNGVPRSSLRPLTTQQREESSRHPILTSCTCHTLHRLARRTVDYLPGKTMVQLQNEIGGGRASDQSSVAMRHTVLREHVLPAIVPASGNKLGTTMRLDARMNGKEDNATSSADKMNATERHRRCYDLVESSLLSMVRERAPALRGDANADAYSPTLGGYFRLYSPSGRNNDRPSKDDDDDVIREEDEDAVGREGNGSSSFHDAADWQGREAGPSSYFLFGSDYSSNGRDCASDNQPSSLTGLILQQARESMAVRRRRRNRTRRVDDDAIRDEQRTQRPSSDRLPGAVGHVRRRWRVVGRGDEGGRAASGVDGRLVGARGLDAFARRRNRRGIGMRPAGCYDAVMYIQSLKTMHTRLDGSQPNMKK